MKDKTHQKIYIYMWVYYLYTKCIDDGIEIQKHIDSDGEYIQCNSSEEF